MKFCPKCGAEVVQVEWHPEDGHGYDLVDPCRVNHACSKSARVRPLDEHLHRTCVCGYDWTDPVLSPDPPVEDR